MEREQEEVGASPPSTGITGAVAGTAHSGTGRAHGATIWPGVIAAEQLSRPGRYQHIEKTQEVAQVGSWRGSKAFPKLREKARHNHYSEQEFARHYKHVRKNLFKLKDQTERWSGLDQELQLTEAYRRDLWRALRPRFWSLAAMVVAVPLVMFTHGYFFGWLSEQSVSSGWVGNPWVTAALGAFVVFAPPTLIAFTVTWWRRPSWSRGFKWMFGLLALWILVVSLLEVWGNRDALSEGLTAGLLRFSEPPGPTDSEMLRPLADSVRSWLNVAGLLISSLILATIIRFLARDLWDRYSSFGRSVDTVIIGLTDTGMQLARDLTSDLAVRDQFKPGRVVAVEQAGNDARCAAVRALGIPVVKVDPGELQSIQAVGRQGPWSRLRGLIPGRRGMPSQRKGLEWWPTNVFLTSDDVVTNLRLVDGIREQVRQCQCEDDRAVQFGVYVSDSRLVDQVRDRHDKAMVETVRQHAQALDGRQQSAVISEAVWFFSPAEANARYLGEIIESRLRNAKESTIGIFGTGPLQESLVRDIKATTALLNLEDKIAGKPADGDCSGPGDSDKPELAFKARVLWAPLPAGAEAAGSPGAVAHLAGIPGDLYELVEAAARPDLAATRVELCPIPLRNPVRIVEHWGQAVKDCDLIFISGTISNEETAQLLAPVVKDSCVLVVCTSGVASSSTTAAEAQNLSAQGVEVKYLTIDEDGGISHPGRAILTEIDPLLRATHDYFRWTHAGREPGDPMDQDWSSPFLHPDARRDTARLWAKARAELAKRGVVIVRCRSAAVSPYGQVDIATTRDLTQALAKSEYERWRQQKGRDEGDGGKAFRKRERRGEKTAKWDYLWDELPYIEGREGEQGNNEDVFRIHFTEVLPALGLQLLFVQ